jgi:ankyrin repeat protein
MKKLFFFFSIILFFSCSDSQEDIRLKIGQLGYDFSYETFYEQIKKGDTYVVDLFISAGMQVDTLIQFKNDRLTHYNNFKSTLYFYSKENSHKAENKFMITGQDLNISTKDDERFGSFVEITPLIIAIRSNRYDMVKLLIDKGANVNINNGLPLKYAALKQPYGKINYDIVNYLLSHGAEKETDGGAALLFAINNEWATSKRLLDNLSEKGNLNTFSRIADLVYLSLKYHKDNIDKNILKEVLELLQHKGLIDY